MTEGEVTKESKTQLQKVSPKSKRLGLISVFAASIAISTILVIPLPPPLYEITWSPPIYMALSVLAGPWPALVATALGSFIGESYNIAARGGPPIFIAGIVWARAPEALIIGWARRKGWKILAISMVLATVFETVAFLVPDWLFYTYGLFGYGSPVSSVAGFYTALPDAFTLIDLLYIPIAFAVIRGAGPAFKRLGFS
jgi:uncharacterized membrane protein